MGATHGKPVLADLGLTPGHKSVVFGNFGGQLWVVKYDGTVPAGMPLTLPADVYSTPAVGDVDGDGKPDIVVGYGSTLDTSHPGGFRAYKNNGPAANPVFTLLWDRPSLDRDPNPGHLDPVVSSPSIADLDGDGKVEVIVGGLDENIYVVNGLTGLDKPGWPVWNKDTDFSSPAIFDLDGDGKLDVIVGGDAFFANGGQIHALRYDGVELPGFPVFTDQAMSSSPAIGDIDGDGRPEIVIGTGNFFTGRGHKVYAFHCDGSPVLGWPVNVDGQVVNAPALGDLDGDGIPEVVVADDNSGPSGTFHVYAFRGTGSQMWKMQPKDYFGLTLNAGDPVIADVLNGLEPEILVPTNGEICVISNTGAQLTDNGSHGSGMFSFNVAGSVGGVAVGDFEGTGVAVSVVAIAGTPFPTYANTLVYVWNPKATGVLPWPQFRHDERHSGVVPGTPTCAPRAVVASNFLPITPCRVIDTRLATFPPGLGVPALQAVGSPANPRHFAVPNVCGIPPTAVSISANLTVTNVGAQGELVVYPVGVSLPGTSSITFRPGKTRANNALVYLSQSGSIFTVFNNCTASVDFILDVNGYFQ
ncbi:MAG: VCBS repeat-containing protein [Acidobacteriota bacterium]